MPKITAEDNCNRLDIFLSSELNITRSYANKLIKSGNVTGEGGNLNLKPASKIRAGEEFNINIPESENLNLKPEKINFDVIYQDEYLLIINKPSGLVVHPAPGNYEHTLVNGLIYYFPEIKNLPDKMRPGIVHRLDSGTSGLMVVARDQKTSEILKRMFADREINKNYLALTHNVPSRREGILSGPIAHDPDNYLKMCVIENGRPAMTGYKVLWSQDKNKNKFSLIECKLFTGRTHQIRVHLSALGCPIYGDVLYGSSVKNSRVMLHSWKLEFLHPITKIKMSFTQNIPEDFKLCLSDILR